MGIRRLLILIAAIAVAMISLGARFAPGTVAASKVAAMSANAAGTSRAVVPAFNTGSRQVPADATLNGISCRGPSFCMGVGSYNDVLGGQRASAQLWDGTSWRVLGNVPGNGLADVSCASTTLCVAVGNVIDEWNGKTWRLVKRLGGPALGGVSCPQVSFCMAVGNDGSDQGNVAMELKAGTWTTLVTPQNGCVPFCGLSHVDCLSAFRCMAVGSTGNNADTADFSEAIRWNGHQWLETGTPQGHVSTSLSGVSCNRGANGSWRCGAVGNYTSESPACNCVLADWWNGSAWTQLATPPVTGGLTGVFCAGPRKCDAVGGSLAFSLNGTTWKQQTIAQPGETGTALRDISCWAPEHCIAVGNYTESSGARLTLAEEQSIGSWTVLRTYSPGDSFAGLSGVSCPVSFACVAVGTHITTSDGYGALALRWDGHRWSAMLARSPGAQVSVLNSVSCANAHDCMAVGFYDSSGKPQTLAERWNGSSWRVLATGHSGSLTSVSCVAPGAFCAAVGSYFGARGHRLALALTWNGSTWQMRSAPQPNATFTLPAGVWCNSSVNCTAVGNAVHALTERWNGTAWTVQANPGADRRLAAISCPGPTHCMAVGSVQSMTNPVSMTRTGATWRSKPAVHPARQFMAWLGGVSCFGRARCQALGGAAKESGDAVPLAERWNGVRWTLESVPVPRSAFNQFYAVSCSIGSTRCIAVGATGAQQTLAVEWTGSRWELLKTPNP